MLTLELKNKELKNVENLYTNVGLGTFIFCAVVGLCKFLLHRSLKDYDNKFEILFKFKDRLEEKITQSENDLKWIKEILKKIEIKIDKE